MINLLLIASPIDHPKSSRLFKLLPILLFAIYGLILGCYRKAICVINSSSPPNKISTAQSC